MGKPQILQTLDNHTSQLSDIVQQNYYKLFPTKPYNGFNMTLPFDSGVGTYESVIDNAVRLGGKIINICIRINMATLSSTTLTLDFTQQNLTDVVNYAKSQGLKVFIKPHLLGASSWDVLNNVIDKDAWFTSYTSNLVTAVGWVANNVDYVGLSNELEYQSNLYLDKWQNIITQIKALNSNIKISCSMQAREILNNVYLPYVDVIGCNLYIGLNGDLSTPIELLKKSIYRDYWSQSDYLTQLHQKARDLNKPIFVTEVGIQPYEESIKQPGAWGYDPVPTTKLEAQTLYYQIALDVFANDSMIDGIVIWSLTDNFTPVGNTACEDIIKQYFIGGDN